MRLTPSESHWFVSVDLENSDRVYQEALTATRDEYLARAARDACINSNRARWIRARQILILTARSYANRDEAKTVATKLEQETGVPMKVEQAVVLGVVTDGGEPSTTEGRRGTGATGSQELQSSRTR